MKGSREKEALRWVTSDDCGRRKGEDILTAVISVRPSCPLDPNLKIEDRFLIRLNSINRGWSFVGSPSAKNRAEIIPLGSRIISDKGMKLD